MDQASHFQFTPPHDAVRVGLFGFWLEACRAQVDGLEETLKGHVARVAVRLKSSGVEATPPGVIDSPEKAIEARHAFRRADADGIFLHVITSAFSPAARPVPATPSPNSSEL